MSDDLIDRLARDLEPVPRRAGVGAATLAWLGCSVVYVVALTALLGPFRPGFVEQLAATPRFAAEMLMGAAAVVCFAFAALRESVPGADAAWLKRAGWLLTAGWLSQFVAGFAYPVLEPSMLGKRDHCVYEAYLYSVPLVVAAIWLQRRRYALDPLRAALYAALAAGMIPALVMQVACMYEPGHILAFHVLPVLILVAAVAAVVGLQRRRD